MAEIVPSDRSFFGPGSKIEGNLEIDGDVRLQGVIQGKVSGSGTVTIGDQATVQANVFAPTVIVQGLVRGEIHARDRLELHKSAKVYGVLRAARIRIDEGAQFEGECKMAPAAAAPAAEGPKTIPAGTPPRIQPLTPPSSQVSSAPPAAPVAPPTPIKSS
jgi:cytoskeletal protein CcmA (bactofilin family)